jgi:hypothetical protein
MSRPPVAPIARPSGPRNVADVAAPRSPVWPAVPVPAKVEMIPAVVPSRTTSLWLSAMKRSPDLFTASIHGDASLRSSFLPPSPPAIVASELAPVGRVLLPRNGLEPA